MELFKDYLLPISISGVSSDYETGESLTTAFYLVKAALKFEDFQDFDRSNWSVLGVSTEEPAEGPDNRGVGEAVFDDNLGSFWHTQWAGSFGEPPHWIAIDMGEEQELHGIALSGRQSDTPEKPKNVTISVSTDGETWTDIANVDLEETNDEQRFFVSTFLNARYFKMTVHTNFGDAEYTHLAEIYAF